MTHPCVHLYCGDGKGKTTCAMGLAIRAAGRGYRVLIAQFLKSDDSGERRVLERLPEIQLLPLPAEVKFTFAMNPQEREEAARESQRRFGEICRLCRESDFSMLVLDEVCAAISTGMLPLEQVTAFLDCRPPGLEVVLTGRDPERALLERADYVTVMTKGKHPYDQGLTARPGIEY